MATYKKKAATVEVETFDLQDGYSRVKARPTHTYRYMTLAEAKALRPGTTIEVRFITDWMEARRVKVMGKPQVWKTRPDGVGVPVKFGMYLNMQFTDQSDGFVGTVHGTRAVVRVDDGGEV